MEVEGQAAIVSGGGSGLGRATARALAAAGVKVTILDINEAAAAEAANEMAGLAVAGGGVAIEPRKALVPQNRIKDGIEQLATRRAELSPAPENRWWWD